MAGSYPDVPSRRMAWDVDGTVALYGRQDGGDALTELTALQMVELNDEDDVRVGFGGSSSPPRFFWVLFPELREVDGFYAARNVATLAAVHTSPDTTNGRDGTWTQQLSNVDQGGSVGATYRTAIFSTAVSSQRGVRVALGSLGGGHPGDAQGLRAEHLYGEISAGQTPDRLLFLDNATGLEFGLPIDYGNVPRGSAADRLIKVRNNSASLTASSVQLTAESLYLNSGSWYTFSEDGVIFQGTLPLASAIGPGSSSPTITLRRVIPDSEDTGLHAGRVQVSVGSWS